MIGGIMRTWMFFCSSIRRHTRCALVTGVQRVLFRAQDLLESDDDSPVIKFINGLLVEAIRENASDIHIESFESRLQIRFRVDGVLREVMAPPRQLAARLVSRIKAMAKLDIAEKRLPQDGRISRAFGGRTADVRLLTLPTGTTQERRDERRGGKEGGS